MFKSLGDFVKNAVFYKSFIKQINEEAKSSLEKSHENASCPDDSKITHEEKMNKFEELNLNDIEKSIFNIKITQLIIIFLFIYSGFVLIESLIIDNDYLRTAYVLLFIAITTIIYIKNSFALYCFKNRIVINFKEYIRVIKSHPRYLLPF